MSLLDRVQKIVAEKLSVDEEEVIPSASFTDDLNADSLDLVELIMAFEEEFSSDDLEIEISDEDTFSNNQKFFSYRFYSKQGIKNCGRQISLVGIKD